MTDAEYDAILAMIEDNNNDVVAILEKARKAHNSLAKDTTARFASLETRLEFVETMLLGGAPNIEENK